MDKLTEEYLKLQIKEVEYTKFTTIGGKILRWCIFTMRNNFAIVGHPSACIDPNNDNEELGKKIAYENTFNKLWELEGYLLADRRYN